MKRDIWRDIWIKIISLELIAGLLISSDPVFANSLTLPSNWILCTGLVTMVQSDPNHPTLTFSWTFTSYNAYSSYSGELLVSAANQTQSAFWIQVDDDPNFGSPNAVTGQVNSSATSYATTSPTLYYNSIYYWRMYIKDNYGNWGNDSGDWTNGGAFTTYKAATLLRDVWFKGGVWFK